MSQSVQSHSFLTPNQMMEEAESYAFSKIIKHKKTAFVLAIMAGIFIGLAFMFYITVTTGNAQASWGLSRLVGGVVFSMGLILTVVCGGELFTSSVLSSIAWANRKTTLNKMLLYWLRVYFGNFCGALGLVVLVFAAGLYQMDHGNWGLNALNIAMHKLEHSAFEAFALGILCNVLVCLAVWLTFSSRNALTKAMMMVLPVAMFVSSGFEHCVANMFMIPLGIIIYNFAPDSFWLELGIQANQYSHLTIQHFFIANLIPVTLGNIVGGSLLIGLGNWYVYRDPKIQSSTDNTFTLTKPSTVHMENKMNTQLTVKDIMNPQPIYLTENMQVTDAIDVLLSNQLSGAVVCNADDEVVGFFSAHDVMVNMWCEDYLPNVNQSVSELMRTEVMAVEANEILIDVIEYMCIDKSQLYPVSNSGIATTLTALSINERARECKVAKPKVLPVVSEGKLVGVLNREHILSALRGVYGVASNNEATDEILHTA